MRSSSSQSQSWSMSKLSNGLHFSSKPGDFRPSRTYGVLPNLVPLEERKFAHKIPDKSPDSVERTKTNPIPTGTIYRSLIPKDGEKDKKIERRPRTSRQPKRLLSSASSLRSTVSSIFSLRSGNKKPKLHLFDLPIELLDDILGNLGQQTLLQLLTVSRLISSLSIRHLYFEPQFRSTYRFAQFVTTVSHNPELAGYTKVLDLSGIRSGERPGTDEVLAGWRDWKLRTEPLYAKTNSSQATLSLHHHTANLSPATTLNSDSSRRKGTTRQKPRGETHRKKSGLLRYSKFSQSSTDLQVAAAPKGQRRRAISLVTGSSSKSGLVDSALPPILDGALQKTSTPFAHPMQSFLLRQYATSKDIPIGALLHIFYCCKNLMIVDLSYLPLASDYFISSERYPPTAFSGYIFVSDVAQLYAWSGSDITSATTEDIIQAIRSLKNLTTLNIKKATWLSKPLVIKLLEPSESNQISSTVQMLDFKDSGLARDLDWAIQGDPSTFRKTLGLHE